MAVLPGGVLRIFHPAIIAPHSRALQFNSCVFELLVERQQSTTGEHTLKPGFLAFVNAAATSWSVFEFGIFFRSGGIPLLFIEVPLLSPLEALPTPYFLLTSPLTCGVIFPRANYVSRHPRYRQSRGWHVALCYDRQALQLYVTLYLTLRLYGNLTSLITVDIPSPDLLKPRSIYSTSPKVFVVGEIMSQFSLIDQGSYPTFP